jgi:hypothetical protein
VERTETFTTAFKKQKNTSLLLLVKKKINQSVSRNTARKTVMRKENRAGQH